MTEEKRDNSIQNKGAVKKGGIKMTSKEAVKLAYTELQIQNLFEDDEEDNQWHKNVINGLKNAEKDLEILEILKKHLRIEPVDGMGTEHNEDILLSIYTEDEEDNKEVLKWLEKEKQDD